MIQFNRESLLCLFLLSSLACGSDAPETRDECNPVNGGVACLMPWPSSAYLVEDANSATGYRVDLPQEGMPTSADLIAVDAATFNTWDGFPVAGAMLAAFDTGVSAEGLPPHTDIAQSMSPDAPVVVVNMETGERLPIFVEVDMNADVPEERVLIIRPTIRMESATRYAVGIRDTVKAADGSELPVPAGFANILAGKSVKHPRADRTDYGSIFTSLEEEGLPKSELVLAWDFVTASDEFLTRDLLTMRSKSLDVIESEELSYDIEELDNQNAAEILRFVTGTYDVPSFLSAGETDPSVLVRDEAGLPTLKEIGSANLSALVPKCVETAELPIPVVIFGHGLFGNAEETLDYSFLQSLSNNECTVVIGGDWIGLTDRQFASVAFAMNDLNRGVALSEKLAQAVMNFITLEHLIRGPLLTADAFSVDGQQIIDPSRIAYFGASLGGILGGVFMAYDPYITRGALGVPGGPWGLLFERSVFWPPLRITMKGAYTNPWDYQQNIALMGMLFEKVDPMTISSRVIRNPLPETPEKQLLMYIAMGDNLVSNIASHVLARSLELPVIGPSVETPFGMTETLEAVSSGYQIYDEELLPLPPDDNALEVLDENGTHGGVHEWGSVQRQVFRHLTEGIIDSECSLEGAPAPCRCMTGACN